MQQRVHAAPNHSDHVDHDGRPVQSFDAACVFTHRLNAAERARLK